MYTADISNQRTTKTTDIKQPADHKNNRHKATTGQQHGDMTNDHGREGQNHADNRGDTCGHQPYTSKTHSKTYIIQNPHNLKFKNIQ